MHRRKEFLIGSLIGLSIMLLALLAAVAAPRPRAALAQDTPSVSISIGESTLPQGGTTYLNVGFRNMPKDPQDSGEYHPNLRYRLDLERNNDGAWGDANDDCNSGLFDRDIDFDVWWRENLNIGGPSNFDISSSCPVGSYRVRAKAFYDSLDEEVAFDIREFTIIPGPSVEIDVSSTSIMRGVQTDVTLRFTHLNNIQEDPTLSYRADIMRIFSENSRNYANECEGTGLGNIDKTNDADNNFSDSISGSLDDQDGDGTVEVSAQIADTCSTGSYELKVDLWDASKRDLTSDRDRFVVSTDGNAAPSVRVSMSESSPVTPGMEFEVVFSFYDLQDGTPIRYLDTLTNIGTNQPVGRMECGGSSVGWGQDVSSTVIRNPIVNRITITSDCPEGSYRLKSAIQDRSRNEIISGSIDFDIGDPDLTPTAPSVLNFTAKQNSTFSEQLPLGSGGDGTLSYGATPLPAGLIFDDLSRTIAGTPTGSGPTTVRYTVTDSDGDSDYVDFTITVVADLTPTFGPIVGYTARVGSPFSEVLPAATGGDTPLGYTVKNLGIIYLTQQDFCDTL